MPGVIMNAHRTSVPGPWAVQPIRSFIDSGATLVGGKEKSGERPAFVFPAAFQPRDHTTGQRESAGWRRMVGE
jgi:hypothetical protein